MEDIYENIRGEIIQRGSRRQVCLYDQGGVYCPDIIIPNQAAIRKLRDFLTKCLKEITGSE